MMDDEISHDCGDLCAHATVAMEQGKMHRGRAHWKIHRQSSKSSDLCGDLCLRFFLPRRIGTVWQGFRSGGKHGSSVHEWGFWLWGPSNEQTFVIACINDWFCFVNNWSGRSELYLLLLFSVASCSFFCCSRRRSQPYMCFSWIIASKTNHMIKLSCFVLPGGEGLHEGGHLHGPMSTSDLLHNIFPFVSRRKSRRRGRLARARAQLAAVQNRWHWRDCAQIDWVLCSWRPSHLWLS